MIPGYDLGTANSAVALFIGSDAEILSPEGEAKVIPSAVYADGRSEELVGTAALREGRRNPFGLYERAKRLIGKRWDPTSSDAANGVEGEDGFTWLDGLAGPRSPQQIAAQILYEMRRTVFTRTGKWTTSGVITVPAHFNDFEREETKRAAVRAGIENVTITDEPLAAALVHWVRDPKSQRTLVVDWGAGTFDATLVQIGKSGPRVLHKDGLPNVGGLDVDILIAHEINRRWISDGHESIYPDALAWERLLIACEAAKIELSNMLCTEARIFLQDVQDGHLSYTLTREDVAKAAKPLIDRIMKVCLDVLAFKGLAPRDLQTVLPVGGMTLMPAVRDAIEKTLGKRPRSDYDPKTMVAMGAAYLGAMIEGRIAAKIEDVASHTLAVENVSPTGERIPTLICARGASVANDNGLKTVRVHTIADSQDTISLHILQGDEIDAKDRDCVRRYHFDVPEAPAGMESVLLRIGYDELSQVVIYREAPPAAGAKADAEPVFEMLEAV